MLLSVKLLNPCFVTLGKTIWHIESAIESFGRNKNRISKSLLVFSLYNYVCTSTQEESSISITITQKFSHSPRLAVPHICPAVALYIQLLFNCPHMHITYFTDVHKSDQVKGLSWTITENIFCRVENLSITFFYKGWRDDCVSYMELVVCFIKKSPLQDFIRKSLILMILAFSMHHARYVRGNVKKLIMK